MSDQQARLAAFAQLLEAEWLNGNMTESAYERLNADLAGVTAPPAEPRWIEVYRESQAAEPTTRPGSTA